MIAIKARLYLLFTPRRCRQDPWRTLTAALAGGVDLVQWRVAEPDPAGLDRCREICDQHDIPLIINDNVKAAQPFDLAGAHIGQEDMDPRQARELLGSGRWLGISTHGLIQVQAAQSDGADYLGFGPMYPTATKGYLHGVGGAALTAAVAATELPLFAIGGINAGNLPNLLDRGCERIAVSSCILGAEDPKSAARLLRAQL